MSKMSYEEAIQETMDKLNKMVSRPSEEDRFAVFTPGFKFGFWLLAITAVVLALLAIREEIYMLRKQP